MKAIITQREIQSLFDCSPSTASRIAKKVKADKTYKELIKGAIPIRIFCDYFDLNLNDVNSQLEQINGN